MIVMLFRVTLMATCLTTVGTLALVAGVGLGAIGFPNPTVPGQDEAVKPLPLRPAPIAGVPRLHGRVLVDDQGPVLAVGASLMAAAWFARHDPARLDQELAILAAGGVRFIRALGTVGCEGSDYWDGREISVRWPDYDDVIRRVMARAVAHGLRVEWTLVGDGQCTVPTDQDRRDLVDRFVRLIAEHPEAVVLAEVANESWQNGWAGPEGEAELRSLGQRLRTGLRARGVPTPVALSTTQSADCESFQRLYLGSPVDVLTVHYDRDVSKVDGPWRPVRQPWETQFCDRLPKGLSNNEPIGWESSVGADDDPTRLVAAVVVSFLSRHAYHVLHSTPAGVRGDASWADAPHHEQVWSGLQTLQRLLPRDLAGWSPQNSHWPGHPFTNVRLWPEGAATGVVRAYAAVDGGRYVCLPMGIRGELRLTARRAQQVDVYDLLTGDLVQTETLGAGHTFRLAGAPAYLLLGRFR